MHVLRANRNCPATLSEHLIQDRRRADHLYANGPHRRVEGSATRRAACCDTNSAHDRVDLADLARAAIVRDWWCVAESCECIIVCRRRDIGNID